MNESKWWDRAKCKGEPIELYLPESLPQNEPDRTIAAELRCAGCPVMKECGEDAIEKGDRGVIRAGVILGNTRNQLYGSHLKLRSKLGLPPATERGGEWPRPCDSCSKPMRPSSRIAKEVDFPGTVPARTATTCTTCACKQQRNTRTEEQKKKRKERLAARKEQDDRAARNAEGGRALAASFGR
jgi:hypothetical protein